MLNCELKIVADPGGRVMAFEMIQVGETPRTLAAVYPTT